MTAHNIQFYDFNPNGTISSTIGDTFSYSGTGVPTGSGTIYDNGTGTDADHFDDDNAGEATTTITATINGDTSTNAFADNEVQWTLLDTTTGETFQVVQLQIESGDAAGYYTLSEIPLVSGHTYEVLAYDTWVDAASGETAFAWADYVDYESIVDGTSGDDTMSGGYSDDEGDTIDGSTTSGNLSWSDISGNSQDVNGMTVTYTVTDDGPLTNSGTSNNSIYVAGDEDFDSTSSFYLGGNNNGSETGQDTGSVTLDFTPTDANGYVDDGVSNVSFRISDIDTGTFTDVVTVTAFDASGNPVTVNFVFSNDTDLVFSSGSTDTVEGTASTSSADSSGSLLIEIDGPVTSIVIDYGNLDSGYQVINISDIHFDVTETYDEDVDAADDVIEAGAGEDTILSGYGDDEVYGGDDDDWINGGSGDDILYGDDGDDTLIGGAGADTIYGGAGDDTIYAGGGDTIDGGAGSDTIIVDPSLLNGNAINIVGSETDDNQGDVLDLSSLNGLYTPGSIVYDQNDPENGSLTLYDGTVITFSDIETVICFATGTQIETPYGPRAVETLRSGDLVLTLDHGPQPLRWSGAREVPAFGRFAPIEITKGALGNSADLIVSPQHRMLMQDWRSQMLFGTSEVFAAAKHLVNGTTIREKIGGTVTYHHLMFDQHQVIFAEGSPTESFHVSDHSLTGVADQARDELFAIFPELRSHVSQHGDTARTCLKAHEVHLLRA